MITAIRHEGTSQVERLACMKLSNARNDFVEHFVDFELRKEQFAEALLNTTLLILHRAAWRAASIARGGH